MASLTARQRKFVQLFSGNGTDAARKAGYRGDDATLGQTAHELLRNPEVAKAIKSRETKELRPHIATRQDRQKFWSDVMHGTDGDGETSSRLKASELLGKSEGDFLDRVQHSGDVRIVVESPFATRVEPEKDVTPATIAPPLLSPPIDPPNVEHEDGNGETE